ncbi:SpaH/EbpB family LPXTG-anchored major pilin [Arcanobacterium haemolyticum]|nr:SpaH/EbpB family LPXTG-anchored major pilin [Arcanobacterium haemolyticum]
MSLRRFRAAGLIAAAALLVVPVAASADDSIVIDAAKNGSSSLTVVKYERSATNGVVEGDGVTAPEGDTLPGAVFTLKKVASIGGTDISTLDYTTNGAWATLGKLLNGNSQPAGPVTYVDNNGTASAPTGEDGKTVFTDLDFGVYEVSETTAPENATPAAPFYVTLPFPQDNSYIYDVTAFPKNTVESIEKTVDDSAFTDVGDELTYAITTSVHPYAETTDDSGARVSHISKYTVSDELDSRLTYKSAQLVLKPAPSFAGEVPTLVEGTDYTVTIDDSNKLTIAFTSFDALNAVAIAGTTLETTLTVSVDSGANIADIVNNAAFVPNQDATWTTTSVETSVPATVELGRIELTKKDAKDASLLDGAVFKLQDSDGNDLTFYDKDGLKVTQTTTKGGVAWFAGLKAGQTYKLVEVTAPDGYAKLPEATEVALTLQDNETGSIATIDVENTKRATFNLPFTGAAGTGVILGVALVVLVAGGVVYVLARKKAQK